MDDIAGWRKCIDEIDTSLVELLNERARCALEIGKIKAMNGMQIFNPVREREIFTNVFQKNKGPLSDHALLRIIKRIIEECRNLEKNTGQHGLSQ